MNHSIYSADRTTHLKIVAVALVAAIAVLGLVTASHRRFRQPRLVSTAAAHSQSRQAGRYEQLRSPAHSITGGSCHASNKQKSALCPKKSWDPALWSIAAALSVAVVYLARLS